MIRIFISHSHGDEKIAYELVDFLLEALGLNSREILCTSNPDQGLSYSSSSITDQLKEALKNSEALIILITSDSLHSAWIPFEAGAFWTTDKPVIPILGPGLTQNDLPGPLKNFLTISIEVQDAEDKVNSATNQLAEILNLQQAFTKRRNIKLQEFLDTLKAWQSKRPAAPDLQQENEQLKALIQDKERSHKEQLEEIKAASQQEKEELEQNYQNQKQKLEQSLQSKIKQLEQELELERSPTALENKKPEPSQAQSFIEQLGNDIKLEMIAIPGGKFMMGSPEGEGGDNEQPQHEVTVPAFYMGKYPITQAQYQQVMGNNPSDFKGDQRPVENVSWNDAVEFCNRLSEKVRKRYFLPSEAEWEYACRAETSTAYYFGETLTNRQANFGKTINQTTSVGQYLPNSFGLYDMHGNVWEWCQDKWHSNYQGAPNDGNAWVLNNNNTFVMRGGSWLNDPDDCRSAIRGSRERDVCYRFVGFRVMCVAPRTT